MAVAGFVLVFTILCIALGEPFLPPGTFRTFPAWAYSNAVCLEMAVFTPLLYVVLAKQIKAGSTFLGFKQKFWLIVIAASYGLGMVVGTFLSVIALIYR